ncbi:hypothetical protein K491DRAFT_723189 [Lophiostoma macrostomum CBS 122681]|uniref:Uncharacterized protein n=1 Tax=Lophiostoma macrostomum CBS 122681 TaxID=1314788 RepID=A0A6A6SIU8_9PLEO|nr:hypothetical protein K491DRAFT_723189 [Lophiostoma macrostomum CBS 122681]
MASRLPAHEDYIRNLGRCDKGNRASHRRLSEALGNVYADIFRFCHKLIRTLTPRKRGWFRRIRLQCRLFKSFESRFSGVVESFNDHLDVLKDCMASNQGLTVEDTAKKVGQCHRDLKKCLADIEGKPKDKTRDKRKDKRKDKSQDTKKDKRKDKAKAKKDRSKHRDSSKKRAKRKEKAKHKRKT